MSRASSKHAEIGHVIGHVIGRGAGDAAARVVCARGAVAWWCNRRGDPRAGGCGGEGVEGGGESGAVAMTGKSARGFFFF